MTKTVRVFYRKLDNQIVWSSSLEGDGVFPITVEDELEKLPAIKIGTTLTFEGVPLGGKPEDYSCIEVTDQPTISAFLASDNNTMIEGKLATGAPRLIVESQPVRDFAKEIDELKAKVAELETKVK